MKIKETKTGLVLTISHLEGWIIRDGLGETSGSRMSEADIRMAQRMARAIEKVLPDMEDFGDDEDE